MTAEMTELARRAVACRGWRWMRGMVAVRIEAPPFFSEGADPSKIVGRDYLVTDITPTRVRCVGDSFRVGNTAYVPDLTDAATLGCLLALVREARNTPYGNVAVVIANAEPPRLAFVGGLTVAERFFVATTEAEALVLALESVS
jgi:hypothetical protein